MNYDLDTREETWKATFKSGGYAFEVFAPYIDRGMSGKTTCTRDMNIYIGKVGTHINQDLDDYIDMPFYIKSDDGFIHVNDIYHMMDLNLSGICDKHLWIKE